MTIKEILSTENIRAAIESLEAIRQLISEKQIVIVGAGNLGKKIATALDTMGLKVTAFADNNSARWGTTIREIEIQSPSAVAERHGASAVFVVAIWSPNHSYMASFRQLEGLGVSTIIHAGAIMQLFPDLLLPHYHFQHPKYFEDHKQEIEEAYALFADDESKFQYLSHLKARISLDFASLPSPDLHNQYFPNDLIELSNSEVFLDGGAYDGDTLKEFCSHTRHQYKQYIALEPDPANLEKFKNNSFALGAPNVSIYPLAVGETNSKLSFNPTGDGGAGFSEHGMIQVDCVRIDDYFFDAGITYLKLDIEGAEMSALVGAKRAIAEQRPKLAVCIYHLPDDLWRLPLYVAKHYPFYQIYARTHQFDGLDFVMYALPK